MRLAGFFPSISKTNPKTFAGWSNSPRTGEVTIQSFVSRMIISITASWKLVGLQQSLGAYWSPLSWQERTSLWCFTALQVSTAPKLLALASFDQGISTLGLDAREEGSPSFFNVDEISLIYKYVEELRTDRARRLSELSVITLLPTMIETRLLQPTRTSESYHRTTLRGRSFVSVCRPSMKKSTLGPWSNSKDK